MKSKFTMRDLINLITNFDNLYAEYKQCPIKVHEYLITDPSKPVTASRLVKHTRIYDDFIRIYKLKNTDGKLTAVYPHLRKIDLDMTEEYLTLVDDCNRYIRQKFGNDAALWCPDCCGLCGGECREENGELNGGMK